MNIDDKIKLFVELQIENIKKNIGMNVRHVEINEIRSIVRKTEIK